MCRSFLKGNLGFSSSVSCSKGPKWRVKLPSMKMATFRSFLNCRNAFFSRFLLISLASWNRSWFALILGEKLSISFRFYVFHFLRCDVSKFSWFFSLNRFLFHLCQKTCKVHHPLLRKFVLVLIGIASYGLEEFPWSKGLPLDLGRRKKWVLGLALLLTTHLGTFLSEEWQNAPRVLGCGCLLSSALDFLWEQGRSEFLPLCRRLEAWLLDGVIFWPRTLLDDNFFDRFEEVLPMFLEFGELLGDSVNILLLGGLEK